MIVGYLKDVEIVVFEIFKIVKLNIIIVDMIILLLLFVVYLYDMVKEKGLYMMDVFVIGGEVGVIVGILFIMVGGDEINFDIISFLLEIFGKII